MRAVASALAVVLLLGVAVAWLYLQGEPEPAPLPDGNAPGAAPDALAAGSNAAGGAPRSVPNAPTSTSLRLPDGLAARATACLLVLDAVSGAPIPGAAVYRLREITDEAALAYSDPAGLVPLPLEKPTQLMVAHAGHLLRLAPTRPGSTPAAPQTVQLHPDVYSHRCSFRFFLPDGARPVEVCVRFRPLREGTQDQEMPAGLRGKPEDLLRAWREQRTLAMVRAVPDVHVQLGHANAPFVHLLAADDEVAFVESGMFELDAATADGLVARAAFDVATLEREPLTVPLRSGRSIRGSVRGAAGAPAADALVVVAGGDPLRLSVRTGRDGAFELGPLADGAHALEVRHRDHEVARPAPFPAGTADAVVTMQPLPAGSLRCRVVAAGSRRPIGGAKASVVDPVGQPIVVEADADGNFVLRTSGVDTLRLTVGAGGFLTYSELVVAAEATLEIELWPSTAEARQEQGLTSLISGRIVDEQGRGIARIGVRFQSETPLAVPVGRRVTAGGPQLLPQSTTTEADGSFRIETPCAGPGTLTVLEGAVEKRPSLRVDVGLGKPIEGVRLEARRRP